ncbi:TPA: hypothetical protein ANIA_11414 [Aspergillus nidulans FGSC A4]|uniref:Uncharacterized protein n=1 Tax=Emericella nidulans (strain FGSC A4 / ATCC 38163 / CBS 112.46 / NRRL 194 / M139) TaxID=227321 RepID=C8V720_EMENI|nr:TPA: hypothetical protein ANIA_11414 [Aspergillus nidulans FGSC A4]
MNSIHPSQKQGFVIFASKYTSP